MTSLRRPVISVAIATRNYGRYLPRALESVFRCENPTDAPIQVVVADDASTDNTRAVLAAYRLRFPASLEVVSLRAGVGIAGAKNAALERCLGRTVATLDADDEFLPGKLAHCHAALERTGADVVTSNFYLQGEDRRPVLMGRRNWSDWYWPPSTWVFRNGVVRFHPRCLGAEDLEWMERRWFSLRRHHLDLALNLQHLHGRNHQKAWESQVPGMQATGRMLGQPHADDRLAPPVWACRRCGTQYLLATPCCGQAAAAQPLYFYLPVESPRCRPGVEFSLVMLTRNRLDLTRRAVSSIIERIPPGRRSTIELIFVDGSSTDGTLDYFRELAEHHPVKVIITHPAEQFNYARACNRGARIAAGKYLMLLNNDIELRSDNPWEPLRAALSDPRVGVVGACTVWSPEQRDVDWGANSPPYRPVNRPLTGDFWGARREVYWELGGVDESFAGYGYDEMDFEYRAQLAHYHLALARVQVHHEFHGTFTPVFGSAMAAMERQNRVAFARKHGQAVYNDGARVEPFAGHRVPAASLVIAAGNDAPRLRETFRRAASDARCGNGSVQIVVVDDGSTDETALILEEYRARLPRCLTVIRLAAPVGPAQARQIGQARAVGQTVHTLAPGDWSDAALPSGEALREGADHRAPPAEVPAGSRAMPARPSASAREVGIRVDPVSGIGGPA